MPEPHSERTLTRADFDAIIFDNDGVLVDSERIHIEVELQLLEELGLDYAYEDYLSRFVGLSSPDFHAQLSRDHQSRLGRPFPSDFDETLTGRVWPLMEAELDALPGIADLIDRAAKPVAVASSAPPERLNRKLVLTGLHALFAPHIYSAQQVEHGKPAPDLFLFAAQQLGVRPERCVVIEDSVNGVRAGRSAGMIVIGFVGGGHADADLAQRLLAAGADMISAAHETLLQD